MSESKQQPTNKEIPYLPDLVSFYNHVNAKPPLHKDFDIREIDPEVLKAYDFVAKPFRHSFYCIALFLEGDVNLNAGFWKTRLDKPALYFKTPCQVVSWEKPSRWLKEYFIVFTENFMLSHKVLADIIFDLPFFQLEKAIPFEIEADEVELLADLYKKILSEYRSDKPDKFELIVSYTHILLIHVRRMYFRYAETDKALIAHIHEHENTLVDRYRFLIRQNILGGNIDKRNFTVKQLASQLSTHPNHLNAVIKRQEQKTAIALMHEQISHEAQSLLSQTELTLKEIAFKLGFGDSSHFSHFFKKQTGITPAAYRREKNQ
ncbi:MAG: AraC family transcriptional regulator [Mucilaginibacter sp.]|nr:AraC family transcriptional regulator [Mucilaginibacter sp.]